MLKDENGESAVPKYKTKGKIAFDTVAMPFSVREGRYVGDAMIKPQTEQEAREMVEATLNYIVDNLLRKDPHIEEESDGGIARRDTGIQISSGIAYMEPKSDYIWTTAANSFVTFGVLEDLAQIVRNNSISVQDREQEIHNLAEKIFEIYKKKNTDATGITGGINFLDEDVWKLLGCKDVLLNSRGEVVPEAIVERGIYSGAPVETTKKLLRYVSRNILAQEKFGSTGYSQPMVTEVDAEEIEKN